MAVYNVNDPRSYLAVMKEIEKAKSCQYLIEVKKFYPVATDKQQAYLHFIVSYLAFKLGDTFYSMLREIQRHVASHIFYTSEHDKYGNRKYKPLTALNTAEASSVIRNVIDYASIRGIMLPEIDDTVSLQICKRELESSSAGWI